jgi:lysozyme
MTSPFLLADLAADEGLRLKAYPDPLSPLAREMAKKPDARCDGWGHLSGEPWTCGYGCTGPDVTRDTVWTYEQAKERLGAKVAQAATELDLRLPWWRHMSTLRQDVLANMAYNMGLTRLLGFKRALSAMEMGRYAVAATEMMDSLWARQVGDRAQRLAAQMRTGRRTL